MAQPARSRIAKGEERRTAIVRAAAALLVEAGPAALTHRTVAERAGVPLAATTYYFSGLDDLLGAAGERVVDAWAVHAERVVGRRAEQVAAAARAGDPGPLADALVELVLPRREDRLGPHYEHLAAAARRPRLAASYAAGRERIDAAVAELLRSGGSACSPRLAVAVVDGAAVTALSEGRSARTLALELLRDVL